MLSFEISTRMLSNISLKANSISPHKRRSHIIKIDVV